MPTARLAGICLIQAAALAFAPAAAAQAQDTLLQSIPGPVTGLQSGARLGSSVAVDGDYTAVGAPYDDIGSSNSGVVKVFHTQTGALLHVIPNPSAAQNDLFGTSIALSGTRLVVGAPDHDAPGATNTGRAYVFDLNSGTPVLVATLDNPTPAGNDQFGKSVAISGTRVAVGAHLDDVGSNTDAGSVHVFDLNGGTPTLVATLNHPSPAANDQFGFSVGISGTRVVAGAHLDNLGSNADAGSAYVFDINSSTPLVPVATLNKTSPAANDHFGFSVAVSGTRVVVGATNDDTGASNAGSAYVYELSEILPPGDIAPPVLAVTLNNPQPAADDIFGCSVAISGTRVVVGAYQDDTGASNAGSAYLYILNSTTPAAILNNPSPQGADWFGTSVAISDTNVVVGAPFDDTGSTDSGSAYVYQSTNTEPGVTLNNPSPAAENSFGWSVAVSGTRMVVGMPYDDILAADAGRAYVYDLAGATPTVPALVLTNPNPAANDQFGTAVAISGARVVVSAHLNDPGGITDAGSVYVYDLESGTPGIPVLTLDNPNPAANDWFGYSLAISETRLAVGAYLDDAGATDAGSAYVYDLGGGIPQTPPLPTVINNPLPAAQDYFGFSIAISGTKLVIGAYQDDTVENNSGSAYVYDLGSITPAAPVATINNPAEEPGDWFGYAVGISGTRIVIGAHLNDTGEPNSGCAYLYDFADHTSGTPPPPPVILPNPSQAAADSFGLAVAISSSRVLIATPNQDTGASNAGKAYVFDLNSQTLQTPVAILNNPSPAVDDQFGRAVAIAGKTCVIGAPFDDSMVPNSGAVFVFGPAAQISVEQPSGTVLAESGAAIDAGDVFVGGSSENLTFTIRNNGTADLEGIAVSLGGANAGDFVLDATATAASLPPGAATTFSVQFAPDAAGEFSASIAIESANGDVNPFVMSLSGTGLLPSVSVAVAPESVTEDGTDDLVFTFTRSGVTSGELTVAFGISGTAALTSDYTQNGAASFAEAAGTVTFAAGNSTATITVSPNADSEVETDESVILTLAGGTGYVIATPASATGTILNDDTDPEPTARELYDAYAQAAELTGPDAEPNATPFNDGVSNLLKYAFNMDASGPDNRVLVPTTGQEGLPVLLYIGGSEPDVHYEFIRRKNSGLTYTPLQSTTLVEGSWEPMTGTVTVTNIDEIWERVVILQDHDPANTPKRFFRVEVTLGEGPVINEDPEISIIVSPASVTEDGTDDLVFTFTRSGVTSGELTVAFGISGTSALTSDYTQDGAASFAEAAGTVTFAADSSTATITVSPVADSEVEADETVILTLASGTGYVIATPASATGTILNDDTDPEPTARELYDAYAQAAELTGPDAEPNATPFNDGVSNLLKYAFNMDASGPDNRVLVPTTGEEGLPVLLITGGATPLVGYEFLRRKNSGLTYMALQSITLAADSWEPMTGSTTVTNINETWERVVIQQPGAEPKLFFQMQVVMD